MKRILCALTIILNSFFLVTGQNNDLLWVSQFTGTGSNQPVTMTSDASGNIYVYGSFSGTVNQDALTLTSVPAAITDVFIAKYNKNGQVLWLKAISGAATESAVSIVLSNDGNYFYVSGTTNGTASFDGNTITSAGGLDVFLAKYTVDGTFQWVHNTAYGLGNQGNGSLSVDPSGNIVQLGVFTNTVTFYGGTTTLNDASGFRQNFFAKYDSNGNLLWAKQIQDNSSNTFAKTVTAYSGGYFISGNYTGSLTLDIGVITSTGLNDGFLYKTDLNGNGIFVRKVSGVLGDETINRHRSDVNGYQFLIGYYSSATLTVDSLAAVTSVKTFPNAGAVGTNDIFYACYAPDGTLQFANRYGSAGDDRGLSIYPDANHVIIGGQYSTAVSFDSFNLTNSGSTDAFMVETDRNGAVFSANKASGALSDYVLTSNIDKDGLNLFVGEFYSAPLTIGNKTLNDAAGGARDMFMARYGTITLSYTVTDVLCNGNLTGAIDLTVSGDGTSPYTYSWAGPSGFTATSEDISGLAAGTYNITITDALGATKTGSTTVTESSALALVFSVTNTKCPTSTDGAIDLTVVGGTSPYTYSWTGGITTEDLSALAAGTYDVTVTDANSCTKTGSAIVANPAAMILTSVITSPTCVPGGDGAVDLTVINGTGPYTYAWSNLAVTQDISALVSGTYGVTVTDANLCTVTGSYDVINPSAPQVIASKTGLTCVPGNDGAIDILVSGGTIPYTYLWNDAVTTQDRTGLSAGSYAVTVTDAASCSATTATIVLSTPVSPSISFVNTNPTCVPGNDGAIDLIVYSGIPPYTYNWTGGIVTEDISALVEGVYDVTVTDNNGCSVTGSSAISRQFPAATVTASGSTTICAGETVQLNANTGTGLSYQWQLTGVDIAGAVAGSYVASAAGDYTVVVTGSNGCSSTSVATTVTVNSLPATYNITGGGDYCTGGTGVSVGLSFSDIGVNYELFLDGVTTTNILAGTGAALDFGLQTIAGNYTVVATNASFCTQLMSGSATVTVNSLPTATVTATGPVAFCTGGTVQLNATNTPGCSYQWQESGVDITGATGTSYTVSASGSYAVIITNIYGCSATSAATVVTVSSVPSATITPAGPTTFCSGGSVQLDANAGVGYTYQWQLNGVDIIGETNQSYTALAGGDYTVVVTNAGCSATSTATTVTVNVAPSATITASGATTFCQEQSVVLLSNVGGGYTYQWQESGTDIPGAVSSAYTALTGGSYTVIVTNFNGCSTTSLAEVVTVNPLPIVTTALSANPICEGSSVDVIVTLTGTGPWLISGTETVNGIIQNTFTNVPVAVSPVTINVTPSAGTYSYSITSVSDVNCTNTGNIGGNASTVVVSPQMLLLFNTTNPNCGVGNDGAIDLSVVNGTTPYTYLWNDLSASTTQDISGLTSGTYTVTVTDGAGCTRVDSISLVNPSAPVLSFSSTDPTCVPGNDGSVDLSVIGLNTPFTYQWNDPLSSTTEDISGLAAGTYSVTVTDASMCSTIGTATLNSSPVPVLAFAVTNESCAGGNGAVDLTVTSGTLPFTFLWDDAGASITEDLSSLVSGTYTVTVSDVKGCSSVDSATVTMIPVLTASLDNHELIIFCASNNNGEAILNTQNGVAPFTYTWSGSASTTAYANDLGVGISYVTVTDFCGTSIVDSVTVTSLPAMTASITSSTLANCAASSDGSAVVTTASGIAPYTYSWSGSASINDTVNDLAVGWQYVTISDYCGSIIDSVEITSVPALSITTSLLTQVSCTGDSNGTATVITTDGVSPFTFNWSTLEINDTAVTLVEGYNYVTVTDGCGSLVDSVLMTVTLPLSIDITSSSPTSCVGGNNGGATVTATNGAAPISYQWSTNNLFSDTLNTNAFATNLNNAWNYVKVTDACTSKIDSVQIDSLPPVIANITFSVPASCPTTPDGKATVTASNGAPPYTYAWSNSASTTYIAMDLLPGWNFVTVTDQCGTAIASINISNLPALSIDATSLSLITCQGLSNGSAIVTTTNGGAPFTFLWSTTETNDTAIALVEGFNYVTVTDVCGSLVDSVNIAVTPAVTATYNKPDGILCYGQSTASIEVIPSNGITPYTYTWGDTTLATFDRTNVGAGKYYFTVTDNCLSTYVDSVIVNQPGALSLSMITTNVSFTGLSDGAIDLLISGGTQPYSYYWSNTVILEDLPNIPEGVYYITVTDNNGCVISDSTTIVTDSWHIEIYNAFSPNGDGKNDVWNIKYISAYPTCDVTIFDEWGIKVFESTGYTTAWDGTNKKGNKLPAATYYYIIDLKDGSKPFTGSVAILK